MSKQHVLIITYYWPPAGGPGVQRWLKFCKYLPENGISPIVFCPEDPNYPIIDESLLDEVPKDIELLQSKISEPYKWAGKLSKSTTQSISSGIIPKSKDQSIIAQLLLWIRGNFFIPDARKNWVKPSVNVLRNIITDRGIKCIITTGPPHSLHLIGYHLNTQLKINWVADFRDPWTTIGYHKALKLMKSSKAKHERLEQQVLNTADEIIVTSQHTKREFKTKTKQPITVITNGYDVHDIKVDRLDSKFSLAHIGSLLSERNPRILWEACSELVKENKDFAQHFVVNLVGVVSEDIVSNIKEFGLEPYLNVVGYVSHKEAIAYQLKSQILLLIEIDSEDTKAIIPGKLFEYMQSNRPILAIGPVESDVQTLIKETNTGRYFGYLEKEELKKHILNSFELYQQGKLKPQPIDLKQYSRQSLTKKLAEVLEPYV